jgi:hypothetical protein
MRTLPILAVLLVSCVHGAPPPASMPVMRLDSAHADEVLRPGDFLFRYVDEHDPLDAVISGAIIQASSVTIESTSEALRLTERAARGAHGHLSRRGSHRGVGDLQVAPDERSS